MRPLSMMGAFRIMGPAFLVSVALVDPGNWATSIEAGSKFGYELVWVVIAANLIAILLQTLAARLGIVTGKHLAQVCRESYPSQVCALLWVLCEISIVALDLTMLLGTAIGLNLLLGWPLLPCIVLTSLDALLLLLLVPAHGIKKSEALTVGLLAVVVACFLVDLVVSRPPLASVVSGLLPRLRRESVYTAVSLLGANVMPHNFYLHSALVSGQAAKATVAAGGLSGGGMGESGRRSAIRALCLYNFLDIGAALGVALVINVAVLLVSAATFHSAGVVVHTLQAAHDLMEQTLSSSIAPAAFGTALLCAGQLSTFTGTIAGQVVLQGFLNIHISTWLRRLITRTAAIIPAAVLQYVYGDRGTYKFLLIAQVVLALQLPVTLVPLIKATSSRQLMGPHASSRLLAAAAWGATGLIFLANLMLFVTQMLPEVSSGRGILDKDGPLDAWIDRVASLAYSDPLRAIGLVGLLVAASAFLALQLWMIITPLRVDAASALFPDAISTVAEPLKFSEGCIDSSGAVTHSDDHSSAAAREGTADPHGGGGRPKRGWCGFWVGDGGEGGGGASRGGHRGRGLYGASASRPSGQMVGSWQEQQSTGYPTWDAAAVGAAAGYPFVAAAVGAAGGAGFLGAGWVIPSSAMASVIRSGPLPYDALVVAADAALLPLPWRPRQRYRRRPSGCFCSEAETTGNVEGGSGMSSSSSDIESDGGSSGDYSSGATRGRPGAPHDDLLASTAISASEEGAVAMSTGWSLSSSAAAAAAMTNAPSTVTAAALEPVALWARQLSLPLAGRATDANVEAAAAAGEDAALPTAAAVADTGDCDGCIEPKAGPALKGAAQDANLSSPPPQSALGAMADATEAITRCGSGWRHTPRPKHPVSRGTRSKFAKLLEDFWAAFYDAHGRPVCGRARGASAMPRQGVGAQPPAGPSSLQEQEQVQWEQPQRQPGECHRQGRAHTPGRRSGGADGSTRTRAASRPLGEGGGGKGALELPAADSATVAMPPSSPLICGHTEGSHLCMGCSQALFEAVRQCLLALEQLEGVEAAVWGPLPLQLVLPPDNQTFHYHRAILLATRNADFPALQALCAGTYSSSVDQSRLLASMPLLQSAAVAVPPAMAAAASWDLAPVGAVTWIPPALPLQELGGAVASQTACTRKHAMHQQQQQQQPLFSHPVGSRCSSVGSRGDTEAVASGSPVSSWQPCWHPDQPQGTADRRQTEPTTQRRPAGVKGAACLHSTLGSGHATRALSRAASSSSFWNPLNVTAAAVPVLGFASDGACSGDAPGTHGGGRGLEASRAGLSELAPGAPERAPPLQVPMVLPPLVRSGPGVPTVSSWCLFGPAAFVSFGVWSVFTLAQWCTIDSRPAHWGHYASVLNRLQGALRDARLDVMMAMAPPPPPLLPPTEGAFASSGVVEGGMADGHLSAPQLRALPCQLAREPLPGQSPNAQLQEAQLPSTLPLAPSAVQPRLQQQPQQQRSQQRDACGQGSTGVQHMRQIKQPPQPLQPPVVLPPTALRLCLEHVALLRLELMQQLEGMEAFVLERRGPVDTAAGQVAFPKAKEIMSSVMRRYRRRLGAGAPAGGAVQVLISGSTLVPVGGG